jgi:hypothetical protein
MVKTVKLMKEKPMRTKIISGLVLVAVILVGQPAIASTTMHPYNQKLVKLGYMPAPKYYPEIPRIPATYAKHLYDQGQAKFLYVAYSSKHLIVGATYLTEDQVHTVPLSKFGLKKGEPLVIYCQ